MSRTSMRRNKADVAGILAARTVIKRVTLLFLALVTPSPFCSTAAAQEYVYIWLEAEDFATATPGVKVWKTDQAKMSDAEREFGVLFLEKSGWGVGPGRSISGEGYIEATEGNRYAPSPSIEARYDFIVPRASEYSFWIRCDSPPPCGRNFNIWLDSVAHREPLMILDFSHSGMWSWWPWGGKSNTGVARKYSLSAGAHALFMGQMSLGLRIDKILVTNDNNYIPFGVSQQYYTSTFEPPEVIDIAHGKDEVISRIEPKATGWEPSPVDAWKVETVPISEDHYYGVSRSSGDDPVPATALIRDLTCSLFEADLQLILTPDKRQSERNWLLISAFQDHGNFDAVCFRDAGVEAIQTRDGKVTILKSAPCEIAARMQPCNIYVRRSRTGLSVEVDSTNVISMRLPVPRAGSVGIGSYSGGVGFDNIEIMPVTDPGAEFDFVCEDDMALKDWIIVRDGRKIETTTLDGLKKGDVVLYQAPSWSNSEVSISLSGGNPRRFSLLFPYTDAFHYVETELRTESEGSIEVSRRLGAGRESIGAANMRFDQAEEYGLAIQSVKGLFAVFLGEEMVVQSNEYDLLLGTVGVLLHDDEGNFPIRRLTIKHKDLIVDGFPVDSSGSLLPHWQVADGAWKVAPVLDGEQAEGDGQLVVQGKGVIHIGEENWRSYVFQVSALFDEDTELALLSQVERGGSLELYCKGNEVRIRKVVGDNAITLAGVSVTDLASGWHRLGFAVKEDGVTVEIDGAECLRERLPVGKGRAGIRNYGEFAAFDDLTIHVVAQDKIGTPQIKKVDPMVFDIEKDILK